MSLVKVKFFHRLLFEFIDKLGKAFPETIDEVNLKTIISTIDPILKDPLDNYKDDEELKKKSATFKYMIQFHDNISGVAKQITEKNFEVLDDIKKYKTPRRLLVDIDIDFIKLWNNKKATDETKGVILTYLGLMNSAVESIIESYKISNKSKKLILRNRIINLKMQTELKKKIYEVIGEDGRNETVDKMIDEIIKSIQKSKHLFEKGNITPEKMQNIMGGLHKKMMDKYEQGELDEEDLKSTFKSLMKNILRNKDGNLKESIGSVMEMLKATGNEEMMNLIDENMTEEDLRKKFEEINEAITNESKTSEETKNKD